MASKDKKQNVIRSLRCIFVLAASAGLLCSEMPHTGKNRDDIQNTQPVPSSSTQVLSATEKQEVLVQMLKRFNSEIDAEENERPPKRQRTEKVKRTLNPNPVPKQRIKTNCNGINNELYGASTSMALHATAPSSSSISATNKNKDVITPSHKSLETILQRLKERYPLNPNEESKTMSYVKSIHAQMESLIKKKDEPSNSAIHKETSKLLEKLLKRDILPNTQQYKEEREIIKTHGYNTIILSQETIYNRMSIYLSNSNVSVAASFMPDLKFIGIKPSLKCIQEYITSNMHEQFIYGQKPILLKLNEFAEKEKMIIIILELGEIIIKLIPEPVIRQGLFKYFLKIYPNNTWTIANHLASYTELLNIAYVVCSIIYDKYDNNYTRSELFNSLNIAKNQLSIYNLRILGYIIYWEIIYTNSSLYYFKEVPDNAPNTTYGYIHCMLPEEFMMYSRSAHLPRINSCNSNPIKGTTTHSTNMQPDYRYNPFKASGILYVLLSKYIDKFIISNNDVLRKQFLYLSCQLPTSVRVELIDLLILNRTLEAKLLIMLHITSANPNQSKLISVLCIPKYIMPSTTS
ncbi:hypothetical protein NEFER03_2134 [Nematocida sp. LUAm3]|nr:hypothetical protein NEFER03_2134 [Nematocida sp. LUAm3]KAI5174605.1 hypothetical protein NEFER02_0726 [Nematocida sp. LUAm2]KAI5177989.1 hypothetical protein NEFER01_1171 [Nematocida sp. LUAm1]